MREIPLSRGAVAFVDNDDYERASLYKWSLDSSGYAVRMWRVGSRRVKVMLHRFILCAPVGYDVDHADKDRLNCTRDNLRIATHAQNNANSNGRKERNSRYKGIWYNKRRNRWYAEICIDGQRRSLGSHADEHDAAIAYDKAALAAWGEFAHLNFPQLQHAADD